MWRVPSTAIAIAITLSAQTINRDFRSRYGEPDIQRYRLDAKLSLAARYDDSGAACAFAISPSGEPSDAPTAAIDLIVDRFVPHYLAGHDSSAPVNAANDVEDFGGWQIRHDRLYPFNRTRATFAELTAKAGCSSETRFSLEQQYGAPQYERFQVRPGLELGVSYAPDQSVKRIVIRRNSTKLNDEPYSVDQVVDAAPAEQVLDEVLPPGVRKALVPGIEAIAGRLGQSTKTYGRLMVTRIFWADGPEGKTLGYSVLLP